MNYKQKGTLAEKVKGTGDYLIGEIKARLIPSVLSDIAIGTDEYQREVGKTGLSKLQAGIPGWRQQLPVKKNIFGEELKSEGFISQALFGSRVKTDKETGIVKELSRVSDSVDKAINFTDWNKSASAKLAQFKEKVGEQEYRKARDEYGQILQDEVEKILNSPKYQQIDDNERLDLINNADSKAQEKVFKKYNFKYKSIKK